MAEEASVNRTDLRPARGRTFLPQVTGVEFSVARRGYDRAEVDAYVERISRIVVELEAMRSPDAVIERALADVGEETSAILRRARKAAEEMVSDADAQAEQRGATAEADAGRIRDEADRYSERVRQEVDQVLAQARAQNEQTAAAAAADAHHARAEADEYQARVISHMEALARDRHELIEDLRKLADNFHRTADRALEQIPAPLKPYEVTTGDGADANTAPPGSAPRKESREAS